MSFSAGRPVSYGAAIEPTNQWSETNAISRHFGKACSSLKAAILVTLMAATPAAAQYTLVGTPQGFANRPITDLMEARNPRTCNPASGNSATGTFDPYDAGTYRLLPQTGNLLNWQPPSGNDDGTAPAGVIKPSGNYMVINAFADVGAHCYDINDDLNGNGRRAELACISFPNVPVGNYAATSFFAEATNTDPSTTSYNFRVRHSGGTVLTQDVTNLAAGDRDWQYNETRFNVTAQNTVEICLIQDSNLDFGADIHLDQIALYATCNGTNNSAACPAPSLRLEKRADPSGISAQPAVNDTVSYTYIVTNTGNRTLFNVAVTETAGGFSGTGTLPSPTYVSGGSNEDGGAGTLDLLQGATMTFSASYAITAADIAAGVLENSATASASAPLGNVVSDTSDTGTNRSGGSIANAETVETADASGATDGDTTNDPTVIDIASPPIARNDSAGGFDTNTAAQIDPLADNGNGADSDPDGTLDATSLVLTGTGAPAGSTLAADGKTLTVPGEGVWTVDATTGVVTFTPETGFTADPTPAAYTVDDNDGNTSNEAIITLDYPQTAPVAVDDNAVGVPGQVARVDVLDNDTDAESDIDPTTVALTDPAATDTNADGIPDQLVVTGEGTWAVDPVTGEVSFTPEPAFAGDPTPITYQVSDINGLVSNTAQITIDYPVTGTGISGIAYTDRDASGAYDSGIDTPLPGVIVELRNPDGVLIAEGVTDANGGYSLSDFAVGDDFTLSFIDAGTGDVLDTITDLDFAPNTVMTNQDGLVVPAVPVGALSLAKTALVRDVQIGGTAPFDITLTNSTAVQVGPVTVIDNLPAGLIYQPDSAMLDGVPVTPVVEGRQVRLEGVMVPPNGTSTLRLITRVTSAAAMGEIVNRASVVDPDTGLQATGDATASIYLRPEAVFHCTDVIGKVFDDRNMDGYQNARAPEISLSTRGMVQNYDAPLGGKADGAAQVAELTGEPGLANVRLVTPTGTIITTDAHGRFSVPCAELPAAIGTNFALKLDTRSLPTGYRVTTENPLVMRLTAGIMAEMNFGAALGRVATVDLTASAFAPGAASPSPRLEQGLQGLLTQIAETPTVLRLSYFTGRGDTALAAARLDAVEQIINDAWADIGSYRLQIERTTKQLQ